MYRSLLHLSWVDKLVDNIKTIFVSLYGEQLKKPNTTIVECAKFDEYFEQQVQELDRSSAAADAPPAVPDIQLPPPREEKTTLGDEPPPAPGLTYKGRALKHGKDEATSGESTPLQTPSTSRPSTPGNSNLIVGKAGPGGKLSRRARKAKNSNAAARPSSTDGGSTRQRKAKTKKGHPWEEDDEDGDLQLDYSAQPTGQSDSEAEARSTAVDQVDSSTWGSTNQG